MELKEEEEDEKELIKEYKQINGLDLPEDLDEDDMPEDAETLAKKLQEEQEAD